MLDFFYHIDHFLSSTQHQLLIIFLSSFLSATLLPGNSEIIFSGIASKIIISQQSFLSTPLLGLLFIATLGNTLGSLTTFFLTRLLPKPLLNPKKQYTVWAIKKMEHYGIWILLLSWLPLVGDVFCAVAGWLKFNIWQSFCLIFIGKGLRYSLILTSIYSVYSIFLIKT